MADIPGSLRKQTRYGQGQGRQKRKCSGLATAGNCYHPKLEGGKGLSKNQPN